MVARLLFIGLWNFCDDGGNHPASLKTLKAEVFPGDEITSSGIAVLVGELLATGLLMEYEVAGKRYWHVTGWRHQKIEKPNYKHPKPQQESSGSSFDDKSSIDPMPTDDLSPPEGKGEEGSGYGMDTPPLGPPRGGKPRLFGKTARSPPADHLC